MALGTIKSLLGGRSRRFTAVDFDSRQMRIVHAERVGDRTRVLKLHQAAMPAEMDLSNAQMIGQVLGSAIRELGLTGTGVLMNVPRGQAVLKPLTLPAQTPRHELAGMVQFQMEKELPFRPEEAVIDFTIAEHFDAVASTETSPAAGSGLSVLVSAVRLPVVDHYRRIAEAAGVKLIRLGLRPYASLQCVQACTLRADSEAVAIVHMTADETEINVLVGGSLTFSRSAVLSVLPPKGGSDPAVKETVDALVTEIARSLQSYQAVQGGKKVDAVLIAGGTGVESRVAAHVAQRLLIRCDIFHPGVTLGIRSDAPETSAFIAALGLAVGHYGSTLHFDFLAPKRPEVKRDMTKIRRMALVGAAGAALLFCGVALAVHAGEKRSRLQVLRNNKKEAKAENDRVKKLETRVKAMEAWCSDTRNWLDHWAYLSCLFPPCQDAYITDLKINHADGSLNFVVKAREAEIITDLGRRLEEAGYKFKPGRETATEKDRYGYLHSADMKVFPPPNLEMNLANLEQPKRPIDDASLQEYLRAGFSSSSGSSGPGASSGGGYSGSSRSPYYSRRSYGGSDSSGRSSSGGSEGGSSSGLREAAAAPAGEPAPSAPAPTPAASTPPPAPAGSFVGTDGVTYSGKEAEWRKEWEASRKKENDRTSKQFEVYWQKSLERKRKDAEREKEAEKEKERLREKELERQKERERERAAERERSGSGGSSRHGKEDSR